MQPDPRLLEAIRRQPAHLQVPLLTTTLIESGGRLDAVGDGGRSHGPFQEYDLGRGSGIPIAGRRDPFASTQRAAREFQTFYDRGARGGDLAFRAQRPADRGNYLSKYQQYQSIAQRVLGQPGGGQQRVGPSRPAQVAGRPEPFEPGGGGQLTAGSVAAIRDYAELTRRQVMEGEAVSGVETVLPKLRFLSSNPAAPAPVRNGAGAADSAVSDLIGRDADPSTAQVVNAAKSQLGVDYSWGGGSPSGPTRGFGRGASTIGFDCSSLVQYAWAKRGVTLPRTTYDQIKVGRAVSSTREVIPGDLLFPSTGHVLMAIGDGKAIEAPRTGGKVQIVPMKSSYLAIRRPTG